MNLTLHIATRLAARPGALKARAASALRIALAVLGISVSGCVDAPDLRVQDFDQRCAVDADCAVVNAGYICTCDQLGALNRQALGAYSQEAERLAKQCPTYDGLSSPQPQIDPCYPADGVCVANVCAVQRRPSMRDAESRQAPQMSPMD